MKRPRLLLVGLFLLMPSLVAAQTIDKSKLEQVFGRPGSQIGEIYKFGFPRTDLHVKVQGVAVRPGLALGAWAAFVGSEQSATVMGDLVLLSGEVNPVMEKLRASGFEITALHNHLIGEAPRVMYMHYMGQGQAEELARSLRAALALTKTPLSQPATGAKPSSQPAFVKTVEAILNRGGNFGGGVLGFGIPREQPVKSNGMTVPPAMGVAEGINFQEAGPGQVATAGDFVLTADEVNPVISALLDHHIIVTALHNHMLEEQPRLFFMHFWGVGPTEEVAAGIKAALEKVGVKP